MNSTSPFEYRGIQFPGTDTLMEQDIYRLVSVLRSIPENGGLAYFQIMKMCDAVDDATDADSCKAAAIRLISWFASAKYREKFIGQIIDYKTYEIGSMSIFDVVIRACPICGAPGEVNPPYEDNKISVTYHVVEPFFMGASVIERCEWPVSMWSKYDDKN